LVERIDSLKEHPVAGLEVLRVAEPELVEVAVTFDFEDQPWWSFEIQTKHHILTRMIVQQEQLSLIKLWKELKFLYVSDV
jgi:hypothetical protein